ncbi:sterol desaturase domain protein [Mycobacterium kansasii]|uniref:Sterol desaturase domain protein n=1 Tax=Mycobacterium kansasii TaxID=1768 RepID=A0A1V3XU10_MYCKA|nr:sterol desaturase domain protein [Mycobacterium kansasii]
MRPLRWLIATPQFHHWHHARQPQAYNTNYAAEFPIVDALFGTLYLPTGRWPRSTASTMTNPTVICVSSCGRCADRRQSQSSPASMASLTSCAWATCAGV